LAGAEDCRERVGCRGSAAGLVAPGLALGPLVRPGAGRRGRLARDHHAQPRPRPPSRTRVPTPRGDRRLGRGAGRAAAAGGGSRDRLRAARAAERRGDRAHGARAATEAGGGDGVLRRAVAERDRHAAGRTARHDQILDEAGAHEAPRARAGGGAAMSRHRDDHLELCAAHVLGVLDEAGRAELEAHLAEGCPECQAELRALSSGAFVLAMSVPQQRAPAAVRARVLAAIDAGGASGRQMGETSVIALPRRPWYASPAGALLAAAALIAVALAGISAWRRTEELTREQ